MKNVAILYPVFVQVALTFALLFWMGGARVAAIRAGEVRRNDPGVRPTWLGRAGTVSNAFHNQLEVPMLFYAVVAFAMLAGGVDSALVTMAWVYVVLRLIHAGIFVTYNKIPHRFGVYVVSCLVLGAMWVKLALHVMSAGA